MAIKKIEYPVDIPKMIPAVYAGEESVTYPNGLITKMGKTTNPTADVTGAGATTSVTFATAFPNAIKSISAIVKEEGAKGGVIVTVKNVSVTGFTLHYRDIGALVQNCDGIYWEAKGY